MDTETINRNIGNQLKNLRKQAGLTQQELADRTELTKGFISQLERGQVSPSIVTLLDLIECLGTTPSDFFKASGQEQIVFQPNECFEKTDSTGNITRWIVPSAQSNQMEPILVTLAPGQQSEPDSPHNGEEFGYILNCRVMSVDYNNHCFHVKTERNEIFEAGQLIIACGGAVQPKLGGTTDGYALLEKLGHKIIDPVPALVPFNTDHKSISGLSGLRIRCSVRLMKDQHMIHAENGEVLFTDYGVSGICIMQCARFAAQPGTYLELDFLANTFPDGSKLRDEINRRKQFFSDCSPLWLMNGILPEKLAYAVLKQAGLPLRGETAGDTEEGLLDHIIETASHYRINIISNRGFDYAQVTAGGADCGQFDPSSMRSLIIPDLYAAGEVMNVDGDCGGFNLMFAFASGIIAGRNV